MTDTPITKDKLTREKGTNLLNHFIYMEAFRLKTPNTLGELSIFTLRFHEASWKAM
jgi:hypothetical protein